MKQLLTAVILLAAMLLLSGCARVMYPSLDSDRTNETWRQQVDTDPNEWTRGADHWFLTGDPNSLEVQNRHAPYSAAMSTMRVRVSDFSNIRVKGSFQVQIFGTNDDSNSVFVYGPNVGVRQISVQVRGNTLCLDEAPKASPGVREVIIRIGMNNLSGLIHQGSGTVEGIGLRSKGLMITETGSGNIYLAGDMNLMRVISSGKGTVSIFGANTPSLDIITSGMGSVNVSGNVGVRLIMHRGWGDVNIIGANSDGLKINAGGRGKVGVNGRFNLREVQARDYTCVYLYTSSSNTIYAYAYDSARIGIAGYTRELYAYTNRYSRFLGRYLYAENAYVRASDSSHINVTATNGIFAAATNSGSVYFFGEPKLLSQFVSGYGTVIPIWTRDSARSKRLYSRYSYKDESDAPRFRWNHGRLQSETPGY